MLKPLRTAARLLRLQVMSGGRLSVGDNFAIGCNAKMLCPNFVRAGVEPGGFIGNDHEITPAGSHAIAMNDVGAGSVVDSLLQ